MIGFPSETIIREADVTATQWIHLGGIDCFEHLAIGILEPSDRPKADRQTDRQKGGKAGMEEGRQAGRLTDRQTRVRQCRLTDSSETDRQTYRIEADIQALRQTDNRQGGSEACRQT